MHLELIVGILIIVALGFVAAQWMRGDPKPILPPTQYHLGEAQAIGELGSILWRHSGRLKSDLRGLGAPSSEPIKMVPLSAIPPQIDADGYALLWEQNANFQLDGAAFSLSWWREAYAAVFSITPDGGRYLLADGTLCHFEHDGATITLRHGQKALAHCQNDTIRIIDGSSYQLTAEAVQDDDGHTLITRAEGGMPATTGIILTEHLPGEHIEPLLMCFCYRQVKQ